MVIKLLCSNKLIIEPFIAWKAKNEERSVYGPTQPMCLNVLKMIDFNLFQTKQIYFRCPIHLTRLNDTFTLYKMQQVETIMSH